MKLTINQITSGEEEVIIRCREVDEKVKMIAGIVQGSGQKIKAVFEDQTIYLLPEEILYLENVDGETYAYLTDKVAKVSKSLRELVLCYEDRGFFRCSKSMVLNIYKIIYLKSEPGSRIRATMENREQVMISRKYAKELRQVLKGGGSKNEE